MTDILPMVEIDHWFSFLLYFLDKPKPTTSKCRMLKKLLFNYFNFITLGVYMQQRKDGMFIKAIVII